MYTNPPKLTPRLKEIASLIPKGSLVADIGTDHAYLPIWLSMNGYCKSIIASDIKIGPVHRAEEMVGRYGQMDKISVRLGAGLDTLSKGEVNCIVIAGMGGLIIADILKDGSDIIRYDDTLILQPMTAAEELREFLINNGFSIEDERLAKEDKKIYHIIKATKKESRIEYDAFDYYIGKLLITNNPPHTKEYLEKEKRKLEKMLRGLKISASQEATEKIDLNCGYLNKIDDILKNL